MLWSEFHGANSPFRNDCFIPVDFAQGVQSKALKAFGSIASAIDGIGPCWKRMIKNVIF